MTPALAPVRYELKKSENKLPFLFLYSYMDDTCELMYRRR